MAGESLDGGHLPEVVSVHIRVALSREDLEGSEREVVDGLHLPAVPAVRAHEQFRHPQPVLVPGQHLLDLQSPPGSSLEFPNSVGESDPR
jgi:hypothetical protein